MYKSFILSIFLILIVGFARAQEICDDGIDNDGDGLIDCFDPDCANHNSCDGFYIGNDASCEATPTKFPSFSLKLAYASPNKTANHLGRIAIGDLDRDGIPEIASVNRYTDKIYLLNGTDGSIKYQANIDNPQWRLSIANVQDDNCGEVFAINYSGWRYHIISFDCQLNKLWTSEDLPHDPVHIGYADFDHDGKPEMYYKDEIRDPVTGTRLVKGDQSNWKNIGGGPVAVDILGDDKLELVNNNKIYAVNLGARTADAGSLTLLATMPGYYKVKRQENATSVADYNLDGYLDVITTGEDKNGITTVYFWDVHNNTVKTFSDPLPSSDPAVGGSSDYVYGWVGGTGRLNIGDLDGDGKQNVSFVSGRFLYALDENWNLLWRVVINEETSGYTGCTLFDFNGDGQMEVVYRDEQWLYIINGNNGSINTQFRCISRTNVEYPIVADADADGSTEICVPCGTDDVKAWANFGTLSYSENSQVRVFKSAGEPWVPARRVWNQHGYFNVNINDNLSVPKYQQHHQLIFSSGDCTSGPNRPLNSFLNQSPFLNSQGCPTYASPDLNIVDTTFSITPPKCPDTDFNIKFVLTNQGDVAISGDVPISFYAGDPLAAGATWLGTKFITVNKFAVGKDSTVNIPVTGTGGAFTLYAVLNDDGSTTPTPITLPNTNFLECDYGNNIVSAAVNPIPFALSAETTKNVTCSSGASIPPNGSARAYRLIGSTEETAGYDFYWYNGTSVTGTPDFTGAIYSGLAAGTYTVFAQNKTAGCSSDTVQVVVQDSATTINAVISVDKTHTNCKNPNGRLSVSVNGGDPVGNYKYEWYVGNTVGGGLIISKSHVATGLDAGTYTVLVTEKATGCQTIVSKDVPEAATTPVITASAVDIVCSSATSGSVTANVNGDTTNYDFEWFIGPSETPSPDYTTATVNNLPQGDYTVIATAKSSKCKSAPVTVTVNQTVAPTISGVSGTNNNSCDSSLPNGSVSVTFPGDSADYDVDWFAGGSTISSVIGTGTILSGLAGGQYTVRLKDKNTGCFATDNVTIVNNIVTPTLSLSANSVTSCSPYNGKVTASVDVGTESDYTFSWYDGKSVKTNPDYTETGNVLSNLTPGFYTVQAVNNIRHCVASAKTIEIVDNAIITITQNTSTIALPSDCSTNDGAFEVQASSPNNTSGFQIDWYSGSTVSGSPFFTETGVTTSRADSLTSGLYTIVATDLNSGCSNDTTFSLPFADSQKVEVASVTNSTTCSPNNDGAITVKLTPTPVAGPDESNYTLYLYNGTGTTTAPITSKSGIAGTSNYVFSGLSSGAYTIEARADAFLGGCSVYAFANVALDATDPVINITSSQPNVNCNVASATGSLEISIDGGASPSNYNINWYEGTDTSSPPLGTTTGATAGTNGEIANNLIGGNYTVEVINTTTLCSATSTFTVNDNPTVVSINTADITTSPLTRCDITNGGATIAAVQENNSAANMADYTFQWYDSNGNILPNASSPNTTNSISGLDVGTYSVKASNTVTGCESTLIEFTIDNAIVAPTITLSFQNPERCANPVDGELHVNASGPASSYSYAWYDGANTTGSSTPGPDYVGLSAGTYTVEITDNSSNCIYTRSYDLVTEVNPVNISASATPVTSCAAPDGTVFATVTSPGFYTYNWTDANGNSVATGKEITGLPEGDYTVVATDTSDAFCQNTATVTINNEQQIPVVSVSQVAPLTICDLTRANGVARATVNGTYIGYTFDWFEGTAADSSKLVYTGPEFSSMKDITYTVRATNNISKCSATQTITISSDIPAMPDPTVKVESNDTHCDLDNGELTVSIDGNTAPYIFNWYNGDKVGNSPDFTGERYSDLPAGKYTVVATSIKTGCTSNPVTAEVLEQLDYPEFEFQIGGSNCDQDNGYALLQMTNNVEVNRITWYDSNNGEVAKGPNLTEVPAGDYKVIVETNLGCSVEKELTIPTEVNPYNGISRNGDGQNSFFRIDCITNYPKNSVKIYNRAGTLIYEANGYDNNSKVFNGKSNRGLNIMGTDVPDGTYFYVIDKGDGSKPVSGYLEIVN